MRSSSFWVSSKSFLEELASISRDELNRKGGRPASKSWGAEFKVCFAFPAMNSPLLVAIEGAPAGLNMHGHKIYSSPACIPITCGSLEPWEAQAEAAPWPTHSEGRQSGLALPWLWRRKGNTHTRYPNISFKLSTKIWPSTSSGSSTADMSDQEAATSSRPSFKVAKEAIPGLRMQARLRVEDAVQHVP